MSLPSKRGLGLLVVLSLALSLLLPAGVAAKKPLPNYRPAPAPEWVSGPVDLSRLSPVLPSGASANTDNGGDPVYEVGDELIGLSLNNVAGQYFGTFMEVRAIGEHIEVWVQANPDFPAGDPRNPVEVTDDQIAYLVNEFDTNIYPKTSEFWRLPETRTGVDAQLDDIFGLPADTYVSSDGKDRVIAMISNVRDEAFFDPTYPVYIAGFFSPTINDLLDRNVITIDAYDWANRVGPNDSPWRDADPTNDRSRLYEGVFAHEYQHLLHGDQNPGEESWVNEGLSDWTEYLVGYGIPDGHWDSAQEMAENSLTAWEDQGPLEILSDYGTAFMFMHYLYGQYGPGVLQAIFDNQGFGIEGVNAALGNLGIGKDFEELYHDYAVARLVLANKGEFKIPDIPSPVVLNEEAYSTPGAPAWGSDYLAIEDPKNVASIMFDGVDIISRDTAWTSVEDPLDAANQVLWSGEGDEVDRFAIFETTGGGTLTFDNLYDIEFAWDYGFVQVSTDGGATWETLTNANTVNDLDPNGYPAIRAILDAGGEGFSGWSEDWVNESFDLSAYAGQDILVGFRFMSDWGTAGNGELEHPNWYIDNVMVDGQLVSDGSDASVFSDITAYQPIDVDFHVDLVSLPQAGSFGNSSFKVLTVLTDEASEMATADQIRRALRNSGQLVMVVTFDAPMGVTDYAEYSFQVVYR